MSSMPNFLSKTLEFLFPKQKEHRELAKLILLEVQRRQFTGNRYKSSEYHEFCSKHDIKESDYQTVLSRLRDYGIIKKKGGHHEGELTIDYAFINNLIQEWLEFLTSDMSAYED